jgi:hypothetical protein
MWPAEKTIDPRGMSGDTPIVAGFKRPLATHVGSDGGARQ